MRKLKWKTKKTNEGITLIALIITIIVLLILAGISIATLTGENGILTKASTAKKETQKASAKEKVEIAVMGSFGSDGKIEMDTLNKNLSQVEGIDKENSDLTGTTLPKDVIVDHYEITIDDSGKVIVKGENTEDENNPTPNPPTLPSTDDTRPFLPEGSEILSDHLDTGVIIKDKNNNEWVWIEVPKSIYSSTITSTDYTAIETAMQNYASAYRDSNYSDTFDSTEQHGFANEIEYNNHKNSMLKSVFENGGFYIGRYETGSVTPRISVSDRLTTPVIQRDVYPYNFVTCRQAQEKATEVATGGRTSSLMFGIQWDLVMKFIEVKGAKTQDELKTNSGSWGNCYDVTFEITRGMYTTSPSTSGSWNQVMATNQYTKPTSKSILLTTGSTERNSVLAIYDLAGNVWEWTLERASSISDPCTTRGGGYSNGSVFSVSYRVNDSTSDFYYRYGSRLTLW